MNDLQKTTVSVLNKLIETCEDGSAGYRQAAENIEDSRLSSRFGQYAQQRSEFAAELRQEVRSLGGEPEEDGSTAGALHRGWINLKSALATQDAEAVVAECERGEDSAVESYRDALDSELPNNIRSVIERQYSGVKEAHDRMRSLEIALED